MNQTIKRSRHPHPAMKWTLLVGFIAVLVLGVPGKVAASTPSVKPPTGPSTGGYFTGQYSFEIYIQCNSGLAFSSTYSNSLEGTHTFNFDAGADGSLLVRIDSGGDLIIYSCGDPTPSSLVVTYVVSKDTVPPSANFVSPADGSSTSSSQVDAVVSAGDSTSGVNTVTVNGVGASYSGGQWHATVGLNVGSNVLGATVTDHAGHVAGDSVTVTRTASSGGGGGGGTSTPSPTPHYGGGTPAPTPIPEQSSNPATTETPIPTPSQTTTPTPSVVPVVARSTPQPSAAPKHKSAPIKWGMIATLLLMLLPILIVFGIVIGVARFRNAIWSRINVMRIRLRPYFFGLKVFLRGHAHDIPKLGMFRHRGHTGKIMAHHHTSYPTLAFLILFTGILTGAVAVSSHAESTDTTLSLTVQGPAPTNPAYISSPLDQAVVQSSTVLVKGTCPIGLVVELYRDGGFAGSSVCDGSGLFSLSITVPTGISTLIARDVDGLGQYGPDSNVVHIAFGTTFPKPSPSPSTKPRKTTPSPSPVVTVPALTIDTDQHYLEGVNPGQSISWPLKVIGGVGPFTTTWNWGDNGTNTVQQTDRQTTSPSHSYKNPGFYHVTVTVNDSAGHTALLQLLVVVNGSAVPGSIHSKPDFGFLIPIWPLLAAMLLLVTSFWLGERTFKGKHPQPTYPLYPLSSIT